MWCQHIERLLFAFKDRLYIKTDSALFTTNQKLVQALDNCVDPVKNKKLVSCHYVNNVLIYSEDEFIDRDAVS